MTKYRVSNEAWLVVEPVIDAMANFYQVDFIYKVSFMKCNHWNNVLFCISLSVVKTWENFISKLEQCSQLGYKVSFYIGNGAWSLILYFFLCNKNIIPGQLKRSIKAVEIFIAFIILSRNGFYKLVKTLCSWQAN